ncbi:MAG: hypothetical protein HFI05_08295 [Lachnospiraceae bacterium]|jgi:hypothetical protein|nr:hypothetical protein [Lachnospiraceae bacterium]
MNFFKKTKGSITVLVTLILVPTIFFEGFMVDLARIKLYSNQAVMTADNYGEAVISMYDNLLKELYGLFAITQDEEALKQLSSLEEYIKSSFHPAENEIGWKHLEGLQGYMGLNSSREGFMPYKDADVTLSYEVVPDSALSNASILGTQIGDFMKFRIALTLFNGDDAIFKAIEAVSNTEKDAEAIEKQNELTEQAGKVLEKTKEYYEILKRLNHYPDYIDGINSAYEGVKSGFSTITGAKYYKTYRDYVENKEEIKEAVEKREELEEGEELSAQEKKYADMYDDYWECAESKSLEIYEDYTENREEVKKAAEKKSAGQSLSTEEKKYAKLYEEHWDNDEKRKEKLKQRFDNYLGMVIAATQDDMVDFESFDSLAEELEIKAKEVEKELKVLKECRDSLNETLESGKVSSHIKEGMERDLAQIDKLFEVNGTYSADNYIKLVGVIKGNSACNADYELQTEEISLRIEERENAHLEISEDVPEWYDSLNKNKYKDFMNKAVYKELYLSLEKCFGTGNNSEAEEKAKKKKKEAEDRQKEAEKQLNEDEETSARDIPEGFYFGNVHNQGEFKVTNMIKNAASLFKSNSFAEAGNKLLIKAYTVAYDFSMFSSRVTNVKEGEEKKESLTGYEMAENINYLYQAELEYLFGGLNSSADNLKSARNWILTFRAVMNFSATYLVDQVNIPIQVISDAASAINPLLGVVVSGALRLAVATIETVGDWDELKKGEGVVVLKEELKDLTSYEKFKDMIKPDENIQGSSNTKVESSSFKLDYEQYLMVLIIFLTEDNQLIERTGNLITLNVNTVKQHLKKGENLSELEFKLTDAYTAVNATCEVHLDFVVMPDGFAKKVADDDTYEEVKTFEKNRYKFTVTRGY